MNHDHLVFCDFYNWKHAGVTHGNVARRWRFLLKWRTVSENSKASRLKKLFVPLSPNYTMIIQIRVVQSQVSKRSASTHILFKKNQLQVNRPLLSKNHAIILSNCNYQFVMWSYTSDLYVRVKWTDETQNQCRGLSHFYPCV